MTCRVGGEAGLRGVEVCPTGGRGGRLCASCRVVLAFCTGGCEVGAWVGACVGEGKSFPGGCFLTGVRVAFLES